MDEQEAEERVGNVIADKYLLLELLGAGGMGAVYEAEHQFTGRRVAVKLMHPALARSKMAAERFLREARAPGSIGHPGIVEVLDGGRDADGTLYLVLELLQGEPLSALLSQQALPAEQTVSIVLELLDALAAAHDAGYTHRDIKPDNVFMARDRDGSERVKLLDFGVAGTLMDTGEPGLTQTGAVLGTPRYMSPEQASGKRADERSDVYSVGALLYHLLSGQPVHRGNSYHEVIVSIMTGEHVPLANLCPAVGPALRGVVERTLRKNPDERYPSARELAAALVHATKSAADESQPMSHERPVVKRAVPRAEPVPARPAAGPVLAPARRGAAAAGRPPESPARSGAQGWVVAAAVLLLLALGLVGAAVSSRSGRTGGVDGAGTEGAGPVEGSTGVDPAPIAALDEPSIAEPTDGPPAAVDPLPLAAAQAPAAAPDPDPQPGAAAQAPVPTAPPGAPLSHDQITAVMGSHQLEIQRCFQDGLGKALAAGTTLPEGNVRLDIAMVVQPSGQPRAVRVGGNTLPDVVRCVESSITAWRFPSAPVETPVEFPLVFQPTILGN